MSSELNLDLYQTMYLVRGSEEQIIREYSQDQMKTPMHMSMGQEAVAVGVIGALGSRGQIFSSYRSHAPFLARTGNVEGFFAELYGKSTGVARGKDGSMHLSDSEKGHWYSSAIVASCIPVALGAAFANRQKRNGRVACVFFGDGAADEGVFWESLNAACLMRLPVLLVCEDNGLAVHTPAAMRRGYDSITEIVRRFKCGVVEDDTTDVERIRARTLEALAWMTERRQPVFLNFRCYRYLEHVGVQEDYDAGYRAKSEYRDWQKRDPLATQRSKLLAAGMDEAEIARAERQIDDRIMKAVAAAKAAPFPSEEDLVRGVFYETH